MLFVVALSITFFLLNPALGKFSIEKFVNDTFEVNNVDFELTCLFFTKSDCSKCKDALNVVEEAAEILHGVVRFWKVDASSKCPLCSSLRISSFPNVKIFSRSSQKPTDYKEKFDVRTFVTKLKNILDKHIDQSLDSKGYQKPSTYVVELGETNFSNHVQNSDLHWLIKFYAPWCGHCKSLAPTYKQAAEKLYGKMNLGAVDATVHNQLATKYNIQGFPTLKFIPAKTSDIFKGVQDYNGGRDLDSIVDWANLKIRTLLPPAEFVQITSDAVLDDHCRQKTLCFIAFLPNFRDSSVEEWNSYLNVLQDIAKIYKEPWGWVWAEGSVFEELESSVGVGDYGYPSMVVVSTVKKIFGTMKSPFTAKGIKDFIASLNTRRMSISPLEGDLPSVATVKKWPEAYTSKEDL